MLMQRIRTVRMVMAAMAFAGLPMFGTAVSAEVVCDANTSDASTASPAATPSVAPTAEFPDGGGTVTVFAAASLTDAFAEMKQNLEDTHPGLDIVIETAGSQTLVTQLQQGAEADVLASANVKWMNTATESDLVGGDAIMFTGNRLVIVAPENNPADIESIDDLADSDVSLILAAPDVPAGSYAHRALCAYETGGNAPDGFIDAVNGNLVSEEPHVRNVLAKIELGEADAGVIYASDAAAASLSGTDLIVIEFPESVPTAAEYPIAALSGGDVDLARAFIAYVLSDDGQAILKDYGFTPAT